MADLLLLLAAAIWGLTFVWVRDALAEVSPLLFVAVRFSLAALLVLPLVRARRVPLGREAWIAGAEVGAWLFLGFALQTAGLAAGTPPARAAFLTALYVVLVPLLLLLGGRRPSAGSAAGVVLAAAGLAFLTRPEAGGLGPGDVLVLGCTVAFAAQVLAVDRRGARVAPLPLLAAELAVTAGLAWPAAFLLETPRFAGGRATWIGLVTTVLLATLLALWIQNWAQRRVPPTRAALILATEPVFAAAGARVLAGEALGPGALLGGGLILAGVVVSELARGREAAAAARAP